MKQRIETRMYNTETARKIVTYTPLEWGPNDFRYYEETLFLKRTGEFFLYGEGNGLSEYRASYIDGWGPGCKIIPLTFDEAKKWYDKLLDNPWGDETEEQYKELFGTKSKYEMYDPEKSKEIVTKYSKYDKNDFSYYEETLYRNQNGDFFILGSGNADSKYHFPYPGGGQQSGWKIVPLTFNKAKTWYEELLKDEFSDGTEAQYKELFQLLHHN